MNYKDLTYLGLSEKEAKVYLAALELGKSSVQKISDKSKVNRATTYVILEGLLSKGLVSTINEDKKQYYYAESPEKLNILFQEQVMAIQRKQEYFEKVLPELKTIKKIEKKGSPTVRYFEGKEGLRAMSEEFFLTNHTDPARMIYSVDLLNELFSETEKKEMQKRRQANKIKVRSIINDKKNALISDAKKQVITAEKHPITSDIAFFGNKVRIATQKGDLVGLIIENKEISDTLKILFDLAWKYLEELNKKRGSRK